MSATAAFTVDLKVGEALNLDGGRVVVTMLKKSGQQARLALITARDVAWSKVENPGVGLATVRNGLTRKI